MQRLYLVFPSGSSSSKPVVLSLSSPKSTRHECTHKNHLSKHKERNPQTKKKKTTLPAGKNTPNTSSTRTTPPSVSRGRISVETPTLDTGPFTLPLFWGREQAERPAAWIWNGTTSKHTWLSPFCLLGVRVSFSQNKKKNTHSVHHFIRTQRTRWVVSDNHISHHCVLDFQKHPIALFSIRLRLNLRPKSFSDFPTFLSLMQKSNNKVGCQKHSPRSHPSRKRKRTTKSFFLLHRFFVFQRQQSYST